jgi:toxin FitB
MIVLDASMVIAHFSARDVHHEAATAFFAARLDDEFIVHSLTLTEILVGPIRVGRESFAEQQLAELGISEWAPAEGGAVRLARLRVETGLKLPDCCVLDAAMTARAALATFDARLARAATAVGLPVVGVG